MTLASSNKQKAFTHRALARAKVKMRACPSSLAFTLAEILVVIAVIGLLSSIIFAITSGTREQGRIAKGLYFSQHLHNSLGSYAVGSWKFDEGEGSTAADTSGWGNNGTLVNSPTWRCASTDTSYTPSAQGCSLEFNGSSNYVDVGAGTSLDLPDVITIGAWIRPLNVAGVNTIVSKTSSMAETTFWMDVRNSNQLYFGGYTPTGGGAFINKTFNFANGIWYHVVGVDNGTNLMLYVNGNSIGSGARATRISGDWSTRIGIRGVEGNYFNGYIDEVRIYSTALTAAHIRDQYYAGLQNLLVRNKITEQEYQERLALINKGSKIF
jgi:prepilin-type N-terminal cleavage/methylation domain-containing protein